MDTDEPVRQVITSRGTNHRTGDLFMDAPIHESIDELTALAFDKHQWRLYVMALAGEGEFGTQPANTPEETKAAIDELPINSILAYTDGGCGGNGAGGKWEKAGFGAWICQKFSDSDFSALADMWGPVPTDPNDPYYCHCTVSSNNTGELLLSL